MAAADSNQELEALAGEFVLGTLAGQERADAMFRLRTDPEFKRAVEAWERRLTPLASTIEPVALPPEVEDRLMRRIAGSHGREGEVFELQRRIRLWQSASFAAVAAIALLLIPLFSILPRHNATSTAVNRYVAMLQPEGREAGFIATVDLERGTLNAQRVGLEPENGKSFELWAVGAGREQPQSLGLVDGPLKIPVEKLGRASARELKETTLAVSIEPEGGSPTGVPTGPVVYSGRLIPAE
jgi:anti-sigma-K factor RskA